MEKDMAAEEVTGMDVVMLVLALVIVVLPGAEDIDGAVEIEDAALALTLLEGTPVGDRELILSVR